MLMLGEVVVAVDMAGGSFRVCRGHTWPAYGTGEKGRTACAPTPGNARAGEMPAGQYSPGCSVGYGGRRRYGQERSGTVRSGHEFWAEGVIGAEVLHWWTGRTIFQRQESDGWGARVIDRLARTRTPHSPR